MKTKKEYMQPEMKTVELAMPSALLAGSGQQSGLITPTGQDWSDEIED